MVSLVFFPRSRKMACGRKKRRKELGALDGARCRQQVEDEPQSPYSSPVLQQCLQLLSVQINKRGHCFGLFCDDERTRSEREKESLNKVSIVSFLQGVNVLIHQNVSPSNPLFLLPLLSRRVIPPFFLPPSLFSRKRSCAALSSPPPPIHYTPPFVPCDERVFARENRPGAQISAFLLSFLCYHSCFRGSGCINFFFCERSEGGGREWSTFFLVALRTGSVSQSFEHCHSRTYYYYYLAVPPGPTQ